MLAYLIATLGSWTAVIIIEEALFSLKRSKNPLPWLVLASMPLGACAVWAFYLIGATALSFNDGLPLYEISFKPAQVRVAS